MRAFGAAGQELIRRSRVCVVGVGGTGSPTAEQLVRLGVEDLVIIDPDDFDSTNVTRVYGSFRSSRRRLWRKASRKKVQVVADHLRRINPAASVTTIAESVVVTDAAAHLLDRDVIFSCTDDHWGRSLINQVVHQYFIPSINVGLRIAAKDGRIQSASGVVDVLRPDLPCLWCSEFLRAERIAAESMPRSDRRRLEQEGYVEELETPAPAIVSVTTALSGMAVSLYLQLTTDFMGRGGDVIRLNYDVLDGRVRRGQTSRQAVCLCHRVRGFGDLTDLPTLPDVRFLAL